MAFVSKLPGTDLILACGQAGQNAEYKTIGEKHTAITKFSLACGKKPQSDETRWVECQAWQRNAPFAASICKGDTVFAIGRIEGREYNGKTYHTLTCDYIGIMPSEDPPKFRPETYTPATSDGYMDALTEADAELPF